SLAWVLSERGAMAAARDAYATARTVDATDLRNLLGKHLMLPMIYADTDHLAAERAGVAAGLSALQHELPAAAAALSEEKLLDGFAYHLYPGMDEIASAIAQRADCFRTFAGMRARPSIVAPAIRADELDVLVYPELGMDACSFALAALRLAPRQYAGWGHPVTT